MELPFNVKLPSDFGVDSVIEIEAKPNDKDAWFSLTFFEGNQILQDKYEEPNTLALFQIQLRFDECIAVMNSVGPGANSGEEREDINFARNENVKIEIRVTKEKFKIFVNDNLFTRFKHREDISRAKFINVYGCFSVKSFVHRRKFI